MTFTYNAEDHTIEEVDFEEGNTTAAMLLDSITPDKALRIVDALNNGGAVLPATTNRFNLIFLDDDLN
jgi:hypothetical protein